MRESPVIPRARSPRRSRWLRPAGLGHAALSGIISTLALVTAVVIAGPLFVDTFVYVILLALVATPPVLAVLLVRWSLAALACTAALCTVACASVAVLGAFADATEPTGDPGSVVILFFFGGILVVGAIPAAIAIGVVGAVGMRRRSRRARNLRP